MPNFQGETSFSWLQYAAMRGAFQASDARTLSQRILNLRNADGSRAFNPEADTNPKGLLVAAVMQKDAFVINELADLRNADGTRAININRVFSHRVNGNWCQMTALDVAFMGSYFRDMHSRLDPEDTHPCQEIIDLLKEHGAKRYAELNTGMSYQTASFIDSGLSIGGTMGAAAVIHSSRLAVFPNFRLPITSEVIFREEMLQETQEITKFWPSAAQGRRFINDLQYSTHALERMSPRGLIQRGTEIISRGIPPSVVENAIKFGTKITGNTANEIVHVFDNVKVVTNADSSRVITLITAGK